MAAGAPVNGLQDMTLQRRQKLMGASGPAALYIGMGAWVGTLLNGFMAEAARRKYGILIATGVIIQATAISVGPSAIVGGRFITGVGVGSLSMIVPMYNAEVTAPEVRGSLIALQQLAICTGIKISFWIDYGTNYIVGTGASQSDAAWLVPICLQLFPAVILFAGILFMPFSPRWLVHHGREGGIRKEIKAQSLFEKRSVAELWPGLQELTWMNTAKLQFVAIGSLFKTKAMLKRVVVATVTMFFQQWTGINAILYYAPTIFASLGLLSSNTVTLLATGVVGIAENPILNIGSIGMTTCHIIIAVIIAKNRDSWEDHKAAGWAAMAMVWLFVIHFGYSWGPCAWILVAEIWPLSNRPYGIALGASSNWMNNFIVCQVTPDMLSGISYGTYIIFELLTYMGAAFIWWGVPETKRLGLEEMDLVFGSEGVGRNDIARMEGSGYQW
ncbi:putative Quinate permease [Sclerotinia borealis F-4128]|uniref:Putative Quinate permease n=1 Tax=Sclerotinia borealis (strain F-4128) TaxID=1432307 RepID=W9CTX8_SCLBF|nr:putative Quinate permease [Sclerotinia borealis F-4128]